MKRKPFLTYEQQIDRLIDRGMVINDVDQASNSLKSIGYYRLGCYWYELRNKQKDLRKVPNFQISSQYMNLIRNYDR